jgi:peptidoglycan/LPS O-acetylase OafA/YrhL
MSNSALIRPTLRRLPASAPQSLPGGEPSSERLESLDALRAGAMLLGVVLHAAIAYMPTRMPQLLWAVHDPAASPAFDYIFWWIHGFRLPLFFLLAGFFAAMMCQSRGSKEYLSNRTRRVLVPLLCACVVVLPATYTVWSSGWLVSGLCNTGQFLRMKFGPHLAPHLYGLAHLWFLEHLFLMSLGYWAWQRLREARGERDSQRAGDTKLPQQPGIRIDAGPDSVGGPASTRRWSPLVFAVLGTLALYLSPGAVHSFPNSFFPDPFRLAYYSLFFAAGVAMFSRREQLPELTRNWAWCLPASLVAFIVNAEFIKQYAFLRGAVGLDRLALALSTVIFAWLSAIGWLGLFLRLLKSRPAKSVGHAQTDRTDRSKPSAASTSTLRYIADSSYWIYLFHMPVVGLVQVLLYPLDLPAWLKFTAAVLAGAGLGLVTYQAWVRYGAIGRVLNGPRHRPAPVPRWRTRLSWAVPMAALVLFVGYCVWFVGAIMTRNNLYAVVENEVYRSGAPKPKRLAQMIDQLGLKTVVSVQGGVMEYPWFVNELSVCQQHGAELHSVDFPDDNLPPRETILQLCDILETAPRPILLHGRFGIQRAGIASAIAEMHRGVDPLTALRQFDRKYVNLDRTPYRGTKLINEYASWLADRGETHSFARFRHWVATDYRPEQIVAAAEKSGPKSL